MNQKIISYLEKNKEQYTQESLTQQLHNAGHDPQEIQASIAYVFGVQSAPIFDDQPQKAEKGWLRKFFNL